MAFELKEVFVSLYDVQIIFSVEGKIIFITDKLQADGNLNAENIDN